MGLLQFFPYIWRRGSFYGGLPYNYESCVYKQSKMLIQIFPWQHKGVRSEHNPSEFYPCARFNHLTDVVVLAASHSMPMPHLAFSCGVGVWCGLHFPWALWTRGLLGRPHPSSQFLLCCRTQMLVFFDPRNVCRFYCLAVSPACPMTSQMPFNKNGPCVTSHSSDARGKHAGEPYGSCIVLPTLTIRSKSAQHMFPIL